MPKTQDCIRLDSQRFGRIAEHFIREERLWRERAKPLLTEVFGRWQFETKAGPFVLTGKADRKIVTSHESLEYFARAFDLNVADVIMTSPGKEPTAKELEKLVDSCVRNKVRVIAIEPQYAGGQTARRLVEELARRGVPDPQVVEIDPLETARESDYPYAPARSRSTTVKVSP